LTTVSLIQELYHSLTGGKMIKIMLFLGYLDTGGKIQGGKLVFPRYRTPINQEIYQNVNEGTFITLTNNGPGEQIGLPIQVEISKILIDEDRNTRSIYLVAQSEKDFNSALDNDDRWEEVLEGNP
jgi:hypothetical protein